MLRPARSGLPGRPGQHYGRRMALSSILDDQRRGAQPGSLAARLPEADIRMARRLSAPYNTEPRSTLAVWSRHLALFSLIATIVSIIVVRFGFLEFRPALMTFAGALALAGLSILVAIAAFASIWQTARARIWRHRAGAGRQRRHSRLSRLSCASVPQAAGDP